LQDYAEFVYHATRAGCAGEGIEGIGGEGVSNMNADMWSVLVYKTTVVFKDYGSFRRM
jgi:hypothetical protein